jgi:glycosyltransferase involved in cell wall biosynthesis
MTLLHIIQCLNLGGMERASAQFCRILQKRGHSIDWLSLNGRGPLAEEPDLAGFGLTCLNYHRGQPLNTFLEQRRSLRSGRYDRLLMTGHNLLAMVALPTRLRSKSVLSQHYHHRGVKSRASWALIYTVALQRFRWVTFPSDAIRKEAISIHSGLQKRSVVLHNPVPLRTPPTPEERSIARCELGAQANEVVIGNAGWLIPRKRFDIFLRVAKELVDRGMNILGIIAGGGPLEGELRALCAELGLNSRIRFIGWQLDLSTFYNALDVLVFSTDWDAFPMTPQESMSRGVPVVASSVFGGLFELYSEESPGQLNCTHNVQSLADEVEKALKNKELVTQYQRSRLQLLCDPQKVGDELCNLLDL